MSFDKQKALQAINQKWTKSKDCPVCGNNQWIIPDELYEIKPYQGGNMIVGGPSYVHVATICQNCGHTHLFNAGALGLLPKP